MIGDAGSTHEPDDVEDEIEEESSEDTVISDGDPDGDNVGDISVEINVEELVAHIEASNSDDVAHQREVRRRLEELKERRREDDNLESTYNFNLDDDL